MRVPPRLRRLESLFESEVFLDELKKIKNAPEEEHGLRVIKLCERWKLTWESYEVLLYRIEKGELNYSLGDKGIRIIDYKNHTLMPANSPSDEFRVMQKLASTRENGVHLILSSETTKADLESFIKSNFSHIRKSLDANYPDRIKVQKPDNYASRKARIYLQSINGVAIKDIAKKENCETSYIYDLIEKIKEQINLGRPVICAIRQNKARCTTALVKGIANSMAPSSNHIVTILGYNEGTYQLRVKNNYETTCLIDIDADTFLNSVSWAYVLELE